MEKRMDGENRESRKIIVNNDSEHSYQTEVDAMIQTIKDEETAETNKKASGKQKLKDLGLDDDEIKALMGA
jgi:hypothetical protein